MKSIITLALFALSALSASAQFGKAILNLRLSDNTPFRVYIDGRETGGIGNNATFTNLKAGPHILQVYRVRNTFGQHSIRSVYNGTIVLTGNAEQWVTVYPDLQKLKFDDIRAFAEPGCQPNTFDPQTGLDNCNHGKNFFPSAPVGPMPMNPIDFKQLKQTIDNAGFESTRLNIFRQALTYNYFTTGQVRQLMDLFWFENSKVEVAKLAYSKTVDQQNYYLVNNEFSFSSSVNELGDYIAMR